MLSIASVTRILFSIDSLVGILTYRFMECKINIFRNPLEKGQAILTFISTIKLPLRENVWHIICYTIENEIVSFISLTAL